MTYNKLFPVSLNYQTKLIPKEFKSELYSDNSLKCAIQELGACKAYMYLKNSNSKQFWLGYSIIDIVEVFNALQGKKILNLTKLPLGLTIEEVKPYANKLTEKQAREIDMKGLINYCVSKLENKDLTMKDRFKVMMEYQGYIDYKDESWNKDVYVVTNIKVTKWSTFIGLYNLHDGTQKELKVDKRTFTRNPLQQYDTIYAIIEERDKKKKVDGQWVSTGEKQSILANYRIVV